MASPGEEAFLDATAQAELVRSGQASPLELLEQAIARVERLNGTLNAVVTPLFERAREAAAGDLPDGPLRGVPFLLKDLATFSAGEPYHAGLRAARRAGWVADHDAELTRRFRAAGLVWLGKTNTSELGLLPTTESEAYGPCRNPWDTGRSAGGSSGGSAAAVAAGLVPLAGASDGGGSIRIPASECGLVGLKPSRGRVPLWPDLAEAWGGLVSSLAVSRSVRDTAAVLDAVAGPCPGDLHTPPAPARPYVQEVGATPGRLRVGLLTRAPDGATGTDPECAAAAEAAGRLLESCGHAVEQAHPAGLVDPGLVTAFLPCYGAWTAAELDWWEACLGRPLSGDDVELATWAVAELGRQVSATRYLDGLRALHRYSAAVQSWWADGWDLLLTPTIAEPPPTLGQFTSPPDNPLQAVFRAAAMVAFTIPFNITGQPAISLPLGWNAAGLPLGVQLVAAYGREDLLLRVAAQLEQAAPWADHRPPLHA
jgi:amidase